MTVPAAQYLRVSTERQQYSLQNQRDAIQQYAPSRGFEIVQTYSDGGKSGLNLKGRPEIIRLLHDVITGDLNFRAVLVYDVSRWGRFQDSDEAAHYEFLCKQAGVPVHYCAECFANDNSSPASILKALKRTMAAEYSREMGTRCFSGAHRIAQLGFKLGGKPGYGLRRQMISADGQHKRLLSTGQIKNLRTDRVILVPGPKEEVECVREMYRLVVNENRTPYFIANELNRRGIQCPEGKWRDGLVCKILTDPKYAGYNVWNRTTQKLGQGRRAVPRAQWVIKQNSFQPIIDPQLYRQAQQVLAEQRRPYSDEELLDILRELRKQKGSALCLIASS